MVLVKIIYGGSNVTTLISLGRDQVYSKIADVFEKNDYGLPTDITDFKLLLATPLGKPNNVLVEIVLLAEKNVSTESITEVGQQIKDGVSDILSKESNAGGAPVIVLIQTHNNMIAI